MNTCEARAEEWERNPKQLAEEFHQWAQWIKEKERGDAEHGYRLRVSPSEAERALTELRQFSASLKYFTADRTGPPTITPSNFDGYLADLERATKFFVTQFVCDENGAAVLDREGTPQIFQTCHTQDQPEFLKQRFPLSMLAAIEASEVSVKKWAFRYRDCGAESGTRAAGAGVTLSDSPSIDASTVKKPAPEGAQNVTNTTFNRLDKDFHVNCFESENGGTVERNGRKVHLPRVINTVFKLLRNSYPTPLPVEAVVERLSGQFDSDVPSVVKRLRLKLADVGLIISKAPYVVKERKT